MLLVTTSYDATAKEREEAVELASILSGRYVDRSRTSLRRLFEQFGTKAVLIVSKRGLRYEQEDGQSFFFHPNLSIVRLKQWTKGENDAMVRTARLIDGDQVLDCTLGMGADAIVSSYVVGEKGKVIALESEPILAQMVRHGLQNYQSGYNQIDKAMRRIEVVQSNYQSYLQQCSANSFDVVVFDPMFRETVTESNVMQSLKMLANSTAIDKISVNHAIRVARRCVLLKERSRSQEFKRLGFTVAYRSSSIAWGVISL